MPLTFTRLALVSSERSQAWGGTTLDAAFRAVELGGETGEALNVVKKLERARHGLSGSRATVQDLADELADVIICVDLLASWYGIDMEEAVTRKFNATSVAQGLPQRL